MKLIFANFPLALPLSVGWLVGSLYYKILFDLYLTDLVANFDARF